MPRKPNPKPPLRLPASNNPTGAPMYELEHEIIVARDNAALTRRAAAGWRLVWLTVSHKNIQGEGLLAPLREVWEIFWERDILPPPPTPPTPTPAKPSPEST